MPYGSSGGWLPAHVCTCGPCSVPSISRAVAALSSQQPHLPGPNLVIFAPPPASAHSSLKPAPRPCPCKARVAGSTGKGSDTPAPRPAPSCLLESSLAAGLASLNSLPSPLFNHSRVGVHLNGTAQVAMTKPSIIPVNSSHCPAELRWAAATGLKARIVRESRRLSAALLKSS